MLSVAIVGCASSPNPFEAATDGSITKEQIAWVFDQNVKSDSVGVSIANRDCTIDTAWNNFNQNIENRRSSGEDVRTTGMFNREEAVAVLIMKAAPKCEKVG
jgi:hypothetical protein